MKQLARACASFFAAAALLGACKGNTQVAFDIALPSSVVSETTWFEVGAFKDASCASLAPMLGGGIPDGFARRVAFRRDDAAAPQVGDLPRGTYAFASVARGNDCAILAGGCSEVSVGKETAVSISMDLIDGKHSACAAGASCEAARCVPSNDNSNPSVGAGCSLELLGAGPLANPVIGGGTIVSSPAIAATPSGFVVVYRELDPQSPNARISILPLDPAGGTLSPARPLLTHCPNADESDGVALVMNATDGALIVARPACGASPGLELLDFQSKPEVVSETQSHVVTSSGASTIVISPSSAASLRPGGDVVAFTQDGVARISTVTTSGVDRPTGTFGATSGNTGAWTSASDKVLALLAAGPAENADAGASRTLRLTMVPVATPLDSLVAPSTPRPFIAFPGSWGALATSGARVIVASEGTGPGRSVTYRTFDLDGTSANESSGFAMDGTDKVTTAAVTIQGDRVFFAALKNGAVSLFVYAGASTTPRPVRSVSFAKEPRIPAINQVRDGHVAIAATDKRVAVAWTTATVLGNNDPTGGYAVFACTP